MDESEPEVVRMQPFVNTNSLVPNQHFPMRIFLSAIVVILGVNLLIDLMDSNLVDVMKDRNETIQRQIDRM